MSMSTTCQIAEYVETASGREWEACNNAASHSVGLTLCDVTFFFELCPGCRMILLESMKQEALKRVKIYEASYNNIVRDITKEVRYRTGHELVSQKSTT